MIERVIVVISVVGILWLFSTAGIWGPIVDRMECSAQERMPKRVQL